ncbi:uncharacterized protein LOC118204352 [Stegodyphus dumicola]|uniref:uncharacterized protein LOC118204352 n=1 Tax=Stegodyphus dumicola TaxID=202533 RepID=UPI0015AAFA46|nr:uncharacterized protein LOC118204352 [Stegodyphus dumicola]
MECVSAARASSHFFHQGSFTRFADWRFIHRARLNLVPLNATKPWDRSRRSCRRCQFPEETLPHVIDHCMRYARLFQKRHNAIVSRIRHAAASKWNVMFENQAIPGSSLRPDLVLAKDDTCLILDATVPFENRLSSFQEARSAKEEKYRPLVDILRNTYRNVQVGAIIVGALGSWDRANDKIVRRLGSNKYANLMRKLIVSETISVSRDIYIEHLTGNPQIAQQNQNTSPGD